MEDYYDVRSPGSYGGIQALYRLMKRNKRNVTIKQVRDWLAEQDAYSLHKPIRRRFRRRRIYSRGIDYLWQADLVDMSHLANDNDGYKYLLTVIDTFSKFAWALPLKKKDSKNVIEAFERIFVDRRPLKLQTDKGKEFVNTAFQQKLRDLKVQFYTSQNDDIKASIAERFNRTLKTKMWKYFTHRNTYKYVDILQDMIYSYNNTHHRTIGRAPAFVTSSDEAAIRERMYGPEHDSTTPTLKVGDKVRIGKTRHAFEKGYLPNWTEEIFTVIEANATSPPTYRLQDYGGENIEGTFYDRELQRVVKSNDSEYKIEKILKTKRVRGGSREYFVKWRGYPDKFNSWVKESDITTAI
jgi:hypothetical protein